jgi:hypothetical protein
LIYAENSWLDFFTSQPLVQPQTDASGRQNKRRTTSQSGDCGSVCGRTWLQKPERTCMVKQWIFDVNFQVADLKLQVLGSFEILGLVDWLIFTLLLDFSMKFIMSSHCF